MGRTDAALERLCKLPQEVSAHYLIDQKGATTQLVAEAQRAWHAGAGAWGGCEDVKTTSIGVAVSVTHLIAQQTGRHIICTLLI